MGANVTDRRRRLAAFAALIAVPAAVALAGCGDDGGDGGGKPKGFVSASQLGNKWPLTVDEGTLDCEPVDSSGAVTFEAEGKVYGVNGTALSLDYPSIRPIWKKDPDVSGTRINIGPLINRGLKLCR
jgi:hypothetical protein